MKITVLTLFPEMFGAVTGSSMLGKAAEKGLLSVQTKDIRQYSLDRHNKADDAPFGGGSGMVMLPEPAFRALEDVGAAGKRVIYMSPRGRLLDRGLIEELAAEEEFVILCGHYEGMDQRVIDYWNVEEVSIGDYILTGGELPAMVLIDAVARFIPGVLGNSLSVADESVYSGLLEHDQYTRPRVFRGLEVPEVLTEGNHKMISLWKLENALTLTRDRRPDLFEKYLAAKRDMRKDEKKILEKVVAKPR